MRQIWIALLALAAGCTDATHTKPDTTNSAAVGNKDTTGTNHMETACYLAVQNRDTILLQLQVKDSLVSGKMQYRNFGMDGNIGTLEATRRNNRMEGSFRYFAEGMWSVREIILEQRDGYLVQAQTTDMHYTGDTVRFKHKNNPTFDEQRVFKKVDCQQLTFGPMPR